MNTTPIETDSAQASDFLIARGGPFYALQRQLRLLDERTFRGATRAVLFIALAWGAPLLLCVLSDLTNDSGATRAYLTQLPVLARFLIAVGLFVAMEERLEQRLRRIIRRLVAAPLLSPGSFEDAAAAVANALRKCRAAVPELACLALAAAASAVQYRRMTAAPGETWAVQVAGDSVSLTAAGWWVVAVSNPVFVFLLLRWLWRLGIWSMLLAKIARLDLRLVSTHPDRKAGLAFVGEYPNAYVMFVFAISCVVGAAMAEHMTDGQVDATLFGYVMTIWLIVVLVVFVLPLVSFHRPLRDLKKKTRFEYEVLATRYFRAVEREQLGQNLAAPDRDEAAESAEFSDPTKSINAARVQSTIPFSRQALLPLAAAALIPFAAAGATQLPLKEVMGLFKSILLF